MTKEDLLLWIENPITQRVKSDLIKIKNTDIDLLLEEHEHGCSQKLKGKILMLIEVLNIGDKLLLELEDK